MRLIQRNLTLVILTLILCLISIQSLYSKDIVRPEEIKSKRQVVYNDESYVELARLWKEYNNEYPSEFAYANWMYAARYAGDKDYSKLLSEGVEKYPANPTLLYLRGLEYCGLEQEKEGLDYLEKAAELNPGYSDTWFALITYYMEARENEKLKEALKKVLESGVITDEIMDYNYNVLIGLEENAIIFSNGDNDTYPIWILQKILNIRPDVNLVNRSLLNTSWYPFYVIEQGLPRFIGKDELEMLRDPILKEMKDNNKSVPPGGLFGDTLIKQIIESAENAGRPAYFAKTMYSSESLKNLMENSLDLGLVTMVSPANIDYSVQLRNLYKKWLAEFRTGGINSWRLVNASEFDAGSFMIINYAFAIAGNLPNIKKYTPELLLDLFEWYKNNIERLLSEDFRYKVAMAWSCYASDIQEIDTWCKNQGIKCKDSGK